MQCRRIMAMAGLLTVGAGLCALTSGEDRNAGVAPLRVDYEFLIQVDARLAAIAMNPGILFSLDEKELFRDQNTYHKLKDMLLTNASKVVPSLFKAYKSNGKFKGISLCTRDSRVFFLYHKPDFDIVGSIPIPRYHEVYGGPPAVNRRDYIVLLVVPNPNAVSEFTKIWKSKYTGKLPGGIPSLAKEARQAWFVTNVDDPNQWAKWAQGLLHESLELTVPKPLAITMEENFLYVRSVMHPDYTRYYDVKTMIGKDALCVKLSAYPITRGVFIAPTEVYGEGGAYLKNDAPPLKFWPPRFAIPPDMRDSQEK